MAKKLNGAALVADYQSSGMTIRVFCRQKVIRERTFFYHSKRSAKIDGKVIRFIRRDDHRLDGGSVEAQQGAQSE